MLDLQQKQLYNLFTIMKKAEGIYTMNVEIFTNYLIILLKDEIDGDITSQGNGITIKFKDGSTRKITID